MMNGRPRSRLRNLPIHRRNRRIARVLEAHADKIADWLRQTGQQARALPLRMRVAESVGLVLPRGSSQLQQGHEVVVWLIKDSRSSLGYRIQTAYVNP